MKVQILDLAQQDLLEGYQFYERQEQELAKYFLLSIYSDIESLTIFGGIHSKPYRNFHRAL